MAPASVLVFKPFSSPATGTTTDPDITGGTIAGATSQALDHSADPVVSPTGRVTDLATIQSLGDVALVHPLYVRLEQHAAGCWYAISADLGLVGEGEADLDALDDLRDQISELFGSLRELRETLGPHLVRQLAFLEKLAGDN